MKSPFESLLLDEDISPDDALNELSRVTGKSDNDLKKEIPQLALSGGKARLIHEHIGDKNWLFVVLTDDEGLSVSSGIRLSAECIMDFCMQFPSGISNPDEMIKQAALSDLEMVGPGKPLGYSDVDSLKDYGITVDEYAEKLEQRGLKTIVLPVEFNNGVEHGSIETLYVYDEKSLADLLEKNKSVLAQAGWPTNPVDFIKYVGGQSAKPGTELFDLVADAFGDFNNPNRKNMGYRQRDEKYVS